MRRLQKMSEKEKEFNLQLVDFLGYRTTLNNKYESVYVLTKDELNHIIDSVRIQTRSFSETTFRGKH
jgi:hypothetical protein